MSAVKDISATSLSRILEDLLGRPTEASPAESMELDTSTIRGLVTDDDQLVGIIGADLPFAHRSGAALAMVPAGNLEELSDDDAAELLEFYLEVANVLSRLLNDAGSTRVRIDPGIEHDLDDVGLVIGAAERSLFRASVDGYGSGTVGIWSCV